MDSRTERTRLARSLKLRILELRPVCLRAALGSTAAVLLGVAPHLRAETPLGPHSPVSAEPQHANARGADRLDRWSSLSVDLPVSTALFPAGKGASIADSTCLTCHSVEMVLVQPPRTAAQWTETINKMHSAYGAPLPTDQIGALALYLSGIGSKP